MPESELFPVICTVDIPTSILENFLKDAYTSSEQLVPGTSPSLVILTTSNTSDKGSDALTSSASRSPLQPFTSPFLGKSVENAAQHPVFQNASLFVVLDERSTRDNTALLAARDPNGTVDTVRVTFSAVQRTLISLDICSIGFAEIQSIADAQGNDGVYGTPVSTQGPQKGCPAPRKKLGA
ncbi:hypothetical protein COCSADRAFT_357797 [Bipolaris sorokiniana ND90Pr]|uniref:Uncharacterized protein n=1 Tax=Cochliobolus sativus (strain ND90Pr / ATCC 201652) TaxID=665912 RepID=M2T2D5_COCSN|nr:uncharacterized protein COCSADRAFT_357797 [Bipolaris sorokiniana ND90Pr]EMD63371.1 hypothetical protein COCSADRAFT_357797 [Bipolaris sorokiniana ND90Pr]